MNPQAAKPDNLVNAIRASIEMQTKQNRPATARKLSYCLKKVESYLNGAELPLSNINEEWIDGFSSWMIDTEGLAENTKATYLRLIYTVCRTAASDGMVIDTSAFKTHEMGNSDSLRELLNVTEIRKLNEIDLSDKPMLMKARAIWLFSLLCGGLTMDAILNITSSMIAERKLDFGGNIIPVIDIATNHLEIFDFRNRKYVFHNGEHPLTGEDIKARETKLNSILSIIAVGAKIDKPLTIGNTKATWANLANITASRMQSMTGNSRVFTGLLYSVAAAIDPYRKYWFAIRCIKTSVQEMHHEISNKYPSTKTLVAETVRYEQSDKGVKKNQVPLLKNILFFNTTRFIAKKIKKVYNTQAYVYDLKVDNHREPAIIPNAEMKMFMFINEISPNNMTLFFPDDENSTELQRGTKIVITEGEWKGACGTYLGPSKRLPTHIVVSVMLGNLGIGVSAHIPRHFIRISQV